MSDEDMAEIPEEIGSEVSEAEAPAPEGTTPDVMEDQQAAPQPESVWSAFKQIDEFKEQDDRAIAERLFQAYQQEQKATQALSQYQQIMPAAQEYLNNRTEYQNWLAARNNPPQHPQQPPPQQAPVPQAPVKESWWNPPTISDRHARYIIKDENGRDTIDPNAPLDARESITDAWEYKQKFAEKFLANPEDALGPMVQEMAAKQAEQIVSGQLEEAGRQQYVATLEDQNRDWLYDEDGKWSVEGEIAHKAIERASAMGITDPEARWQYALQTVEADLLRRTMSTQEQNQQANAFTQALPEQLAPAAVEVPAEPEPSQSEAALDYLRRAASRTPSRSGHNTNSAQAQRQGVSFEQQLKDTAEQMGLI
jgi:hypothetical protein